MHIIRTQSRYGSGDGPEYLNRFNKDFDYCLFRQDWGGTESVFFNRDEIENVLEKISEGEIPLHYNYSILYSNTNELLAEAEQYFGCYVTLMNS